MKMYKIALPLFLFFHTAHAENLANIYQKALLHDSVYLQIRSQSLSKEEQSAIDRALLLPSISLSSGRSYSDFHDSWNDSKNFTVTLEQPLFDFSKWSMFKADKFLEKQAQYETAAALQNLMVRVATAYFAVAKSEETLALMMQQLDAGQRLYDEAKKRYEAGQIIATDVSDTQVAYLRTMSNTIAARTALSNNKSALEKLTGNKVGRVALLKSDFSFMLPTPNKIDFWIHEAKENNLTIKAKQYAMQMSKQNIEVQRANHYPVLTTSADYNAINQRPNAALNQRGTTVSVNLSVPLFQGGGVTARTRQATYDYEAQSEALQLAFEDAFDQVRVNFTTIVDSIDELEAEAKTIDAQSQALSNTKTSYQAGLRQVTDVVNAENAYFAAQADYVNTKYQFLTSVFQLKEASGVLSINDILKISLWLS